MKVLLVNPSYNYPTRNEMYPSGALLLLGTLARGFGHTVKIIHMVADRKQIVDVIEFVSNWNPDIVGITVNTFQVSVAKYLVQQLKEQTSAVLVIGGAHPTSIGLGATAKVFPHADHIVCGEGECQFLLLLGNETINESWDLNLVPPPDLGMVDLSRFTGAYPLGSTPAMFIMASRGCPGRCTFCNRAIFGNKVRYRSPENVLRELRYLASYGIKEVFIQDDTFNLNRGWYEEILERIISEKLNRIMRFRTPFRANYKLVDRGMLELAKRAGIWLIFYGVESGNQGMLNRMHKQLSLDEIERAVRLTKESGIKVETSFILGLPGETERTVRDTSLFYKRIKPFWSGCGTAIPFPSTELYEEVKDQVTIPFDQYSPENIYFRTAKLDAPRIQELHRKLAGMMAQDKIKSLIKSPKMLYRTVRSRVL